MTHRMVGTLTAIAALAALGVAYFAQYVLLLSPCELCLWERWPYRIVAVLLGDVGIAGLHVGVEFKWWNSPLPECNGILTPGAALPAIPATPCDAPVFLIPHFPVSMAMMDLCAALVFALVLLAYVMKKPRRFK